MKKPSLVRIEHLERKHRTLDAELSELVSRTRLTPDEYQLCRELKTRKLRTKDRITALRQQLADA